MLELFRGKQEARATKPMKKLDELAADLRINNLVKPTTLVEIHNAIHKNFGDQSQKSQPQGDGEKVYAYNAMRILQEVSHDWSRQYKVVAISLNKELRASLGQQKKLAKLEKKHDQQQTKLQEDFLHIRGQSWML